MRRLLYVGLAALALFELADVYLIMPMPGSQRLPSVDAAYALYHWRWAVRALCGALLLAGLPAAWRARSRAVGRRRWVLPAALAAVALVVYVTNARLAADRMFRDPSVVAMRPASANTVDPKRLVVGVVINGEARAYPLQFLGYHHQVRDSVGGRPVLVSYCTVCRTGRVFDPVVGGRAETFRLVGMDHWNAMFEDRTTGSWWRQATGEAITGPRRGVVLTELPSRQTTLALWLAMHPRSLVMQADPVALAARKYARNFDYESGASRSTLTGTDTVSWRDKAWVVGLALGGAARAYDWNRLKRERVINDVVGGTPVVVALARDTTSFVAFARPDPATRFVLRGDSLVAAGRSYALSGRGAVDSLAPLTASQEFWHSWRTFHPGSSRY